MPTTRILKQPADIEPGAFDALAVVRSEQLARIPSEWVDAPPMPTPEAFARVLTGRRVEVSARPVKIGGDCFTAPMPEKAPVLSAEEQRKQGAQEAQAQLETAVEAARAEAYAEGRSDAERELRVEIETHKAAFAADVERLERAWHAHHERLERQLVALAVDAAEALAGGPVTEAVREAADRALVTAVERLARGEGLTVRLHPVDCLRLREAGLVDGLTTAHPALAWIPDDTLAEGDWIVDSAEAAVRQVREELLDSLHARLDLLRAVYEAPRSDSPPGLPPAVEPTSLAPKRDVS
ncbi:MAG: hypothetical protein HKN04_08100 [Rhodothermaceae bacterium]|nr:hypothetical protein [Rhodothermaceae bacterium]